MKEWYAAAELAGLPGLPGTERRVRGRADREDWKWRPRRGRGGGREYHLAALPEAARREIARRAAAEAAPPPPPRAFETPPAADAPSIAALPAKYRDKLDAKLWLLEAVKKYADAAGTGSVEAERRFETLYHGGEIEAPAWVRATLASVSRSSLANWRRLRKNGELHRLAGVRRGRRERGLIEGNDAIRGLVEAQLLTQPHLNAAQILENCRARYPDHRLPGPRRLQKWIERWKRENASRFLHARDPDAWRNARQPAFGSASEGVVRLNQLWEADATPADVICSDGRHTIVGTVDVLSRRARVLVSPTSKAVTVTALLRRCILDWGVPEAVKTDNGKDFTARHVTRGLAGLEIEHRLTAPFTPEAKPHVERFLGTLAHDLFERLPGYAGHDVAERQAIRARRGFAERMGEGQDKTFRVSLTAAQLQAACDAWIEGVYERRRHGGLDGRSPFEVAAERAGEARWVADERALDALLAEAPGDGWRTVGKKGLRIDRGTFTAPELAARVGERVQVRYDAADLGRVHVYDAEGRFLCIAEDAALVGTDRQEHAAASRAVQKASVAAWRAEQRRLARDHRPEDLAHEVLARAAEEAERVVPFPGAREEITTGALDEAARSVAAQGPRTPDPEEEERLHAEAADFAAAMEREAAARRAAEEAEAERLLREAREWDGRSNWESWRAS